MGPDGMHPWALREIAEIILRPFSIIFDPSGRHGEAPENLRKANVTAVFKKSKKEDPGSHRLVTLTLISTEVLEQLILKIISRLIKDKQTMRTIQHCFTNGSLVLPAW